MKSRRHRERDILYNGTRDDFPCMRMHSPRLQFYALLTARERASKATSCSATFSSISRFASSVGYL